ncbi:hypothetical protein CF326_g1771 [Tilletia indica]|nr:hypothetical protein CF326_g1771 [Tilletia indica]
MARPTQNGSAPAPNNNNMAAAFLSQLLDTQVEVRTWGAAPPPPPPTPPPPGPTSSGNGHGHRNGHGHGHGGPQLDPPCTCGQHHHHLPSPTNNCEFISARVMKVTLTTGLVLHVHSDAVEGELQVVFEPIGWEDPVTKQLDKKKERPPRAKMSCAREFIEHLYITGQLASFIEFGSGFFSPSQIKASKSSTTTKPSATSSTSSSGISSSQTTSNTKTATAKTDTSKSAEAAKAKNTATATKAASGSSASSSTNSKQPAAPTRNVGQQSQGSSSSSAAPSPTLASSSTALPTKKPEMKPPGLSRGFLSAGASSASGRASSSSSASGRAPAPATVPAPAPAPASTSSRPVQVASRSSSQKEAVPHTSDIPASPIVAQPPSLVTPPISIPSISPIAAQPPPVTNPLMSISIQDMELADVDPSLELDETVIASVSLAYEASDRGQLQTALKCLNVGRSWLGLAEHRGRRSLQAWQDDDQMLKDAEAHIRARSIAQMTLRQLEDLMKLNLSEALNSEGLPKNPMLKSLVKALTVLQDEADSAEPDPTDTGRTTTPKAEAVEQAAMRTIQKSTSYLSASAVLPAESQAQPASLELPPHPPADAPVKQPIPARQIPAMDLPFSSKAAKTPNSWVHELTQQLQVTRQDSKEDDVSEVDQSDPTQAASVQAQDIAQRESSVSTTDFLKTRSGRSAELGAESTPSPVLLSQPTTFSSAPRIDDDDALDTSSPVRFTDADFFNDTHDALQDAKARYAQDSVSARIGAASMSTSLSSGQEGTSPAVLSPLEEGGPDPKLLGQSELVSVPAPFKELQIAVQNKVPLLVEPVQQANSRSPKRPWAIWVPPVEEDLQRVGVWASTSVAPNWSSTINKDGDLGYIPNFIGEEGKLWFGEAMSRGLLLARMSVKLPNAYAQPGYMETLLRQTARSERSKVNWLALRGAPGTFAPPRVLDQFLADAKKLESIQLFILPEAEKKSGAGGGAGGDGSSGIARLPSNLLSAPIALRRLAIVSPLIRTDFHFDLSTSALEGLFKLQHLTLILDEHSDIDVDWVKSVLKLCSGTLETVQLSGALTAGLSQAEGSAQSESSEAEEEESDEDEDGDEEDEEEDAERMEKIELHGRGGAEEDGESDDNESDEDGNAEIESDGSTLDSGPAGDASTERTRSGHGHGSQHATSATTEADQMRPMSKLKRLALEDTASWGSAAQDLFETMHAPMLENLVLAGPRLDRELFCFNVTSVSLWPAPGANAHLPAHMSLSRPKQWVTRMLMHLESVVHLELGVTQRGMGISRGVDTNEIVAGIEQVIIDLEKDMLVLEAESGEAPPQPLGRPLLGTLRSLTIHHLPFDGVSLGRTVMARERMGAASSGNGSNTISPATATLSDYWDDFDDERPSVGQAVALEKVRLVKCEKVTEAMRKLLGKHVAEFSME